MQINFDYTLIMGLVGRNYPTNISINDCGVVRNPFEVFSVKTKYANLVIKAVQYQGLWYTGISYEFHSPFWGGSCGVMPDGRGCTTLLEAVECEMAYFSGVHDDPKNQIPQFFKAFENWKFIYEAKVRLLGQYV